MADDHNSRYRTSDPFSQDPAPAAPASDPLAELARLIGQSDPFSEFGREPRQPAPRDTHARYQEPAPQPYASEDPPQYSEPPAQRYAADYPPRFPTGVRSTSKNDWPGSPAAAPSPHDDWPGSPAQPSPLPSFLNNDPFALPSQQHAPQQGRAPFERPHYSEPQHDRPAPDSYRHEPQGFDTPNFDPAGFGAAAAQQAYSQPLYPHEPEAGSMPPPHDDEFYDDAPRGGRRRGLLTVAAVLALAVVGTAGAFGYRSLFGGPGTSGPPPVIRASNEPSKVAPPPASPDQSASKFSYDRFTDAGKDEQVVKREEKPVDLPRTGTTPRVVFPGAPAPTPSRPGTTAANAPSAIGEPRRVRTVPIRPDQGDVSANSPVATEPAPPPSRQANAAPSRPVEAAPEPAEPAPQPAARPSRTSSRVASRSTPQPAPSASTGSANAPLSLSPDANNLPAPSAQPSAPSRAAAPTRVASAPTSGGGYLVQVSSQRSEADAQSAYRTLQSKYSSVLGSHPHTVRRADLGSKGVYYRAMVGPFGSRAEAIQICSSLKQAGGDCVVQH